MTSQDRIKAELENLEQKMQLAETSQDVWYIIDRVIQALHNDSDLGTYIRKIAKKEYHRSLEK